MSSPDVVRIGIDARELLGEQTGVGRYLGELLTRWVNRPDAARSQFLLYTPAPLAFLDTLRRDVAIRQIVTGSGAGTWWEQTHLRRAARADRPDVFFAPAYTAPLALRLPLVVTIHDVSFAAHPEWFSPREGARRRLLTRQAARAADLVLTDSGFSRQEILERLGVPEDRLLVIPPGVTRRAATGARREPLVLFAGSIFNRRRLPESIQAFAEATADHPDVRFAIVGADRTYPRVDLRRVAESAGVGGRVDVRSYAPDSELNALYSRASVFVFLSEYEGFGLTPLEALSAGVPIVVLDTAVSREVYGEAAWYVSPANTVHEAAEAIQRLLTDASAPSALLARAPVVLERYSWERAADRTLEAIIRVAEQA